MRLQAGRAFLPIILFWPIILFDFFGKKIKKYNRRLLKSKILTGSKMAYHRQVPEKR